MRSAEYFTAAGCAYEALCLYNVNRGSKSYQQLKSQAGAGGRGGWGMLKAACQVLTLLPLWAASLESETHTIKTCSA